MAAFSTTSFATIRWLAALSAWGPDQPLQRLGFIGDPQLTRAVTSAVVAARPKELMVDCCPTEMTAGRRCNATVVAAISMLDQLGPGLTCVQLHDVGHWPPVILEPLSYCTALTSLELGGDAAWGEVDLQEAIRVASRLERLIDLDLRGGPGYDHYREETLGLDRLAALTGLTRLCLGLPLIKQRPYTYSDLFPGEARLWREERSQLLTAVSSMPALEGLWVRGMWLEVRDVAALRRLRVLSLGGLLLPPLPGIRRADQEGGEDEPGEGEEAGGAGEGGEEGGIQDGAGSGSGDGIGAGEESGEGEEASSDGEEDEPAAQGPAADPHLGPALRERWPLPPELEELDLESTSPWLLAALVLPPKFRALFLHPGGPHVEGWTSLQLNRLGIGRQLPADPNGSPSYTSRPEAGGAIEGLRITTAMRESFHVQRGVHASWLPALAPLAPVRLRLERIALNDEDVTALVRHFPQLTALELEHSPMPLASLPRLSALASLRELTFGIQGLPRYNHDDKPLHELAVQLVIALATAASSLQVLRGSSVQHPEVSTAVVLMMARVRLEAVRPGFRVEEHTERGPWEDG
ncbi:hypothetical protein HYH03_016906 [Edaphochlamys debaryana]|uniref:Uncharacterized protein n=1 Tax=Edaphochlamys debaryana TaxID=47281 RepID=A0A835XI68_9CHLO|nr:hypothetical protein HYH03_016906 [Edaphochlamys debaryana]|eukprot:KAG2484261.1 hypothetical protein HYH03_016906 [Edaphochlamys debaryana]